VDACAGRGADDAGNHGSPVLAARIAFAAAQQVGTMRSSPVNVQVVAIEKDPVHFRELEKNLAPYLGHARALQGTLADHIDTIDREFPTSPKFYFIDPFGLEPLDGETVRRALEGPRNEVLVLFASIAARRHFGSATKDAETRTERALAALDEFTLFPDMIEEERRALAPKAAASGQAQRRGRERAIQILDWCFRITTGLPSSTRYRGSSGSRHSWNFIRNSS
jgi:three-Cys-motif partner protein